MSGCLIVCRSITYAQRTRHVLERRGYTATVVRPNIEMIDNSCGFAVKISEIYLAEALEILNYYDLKPVKVLIVSQDGSYREMKL